jgi:hypothetical protein
MAKLTKAQSKAHRQAEELLAKDVLTLDEKAFVYENWNEAAPHDNTHSGAYFTPPRYTGPEFEYKIIDIAAHLASYGAFILPQMSAPFRYSGAQYYHRSENDKYRRFAEQTGINLEAGCGIDTTFHREGWKHGAPVTEIVCAEFTPPVRVQGELFDLPVKEAAA